MKETVDGKVEWLIGENTECICCKGQIPKGHIFSIIHNFAKDPIDFIYDFERHLPNGTRIRLTIETIEESVKVG